MKKGHILRCRVLLLRRMLPACTLLAVLNAPAQVGQATVLSDPPAQLPEPEARAASYDTTIETGQHHRWRTIKDDQGNESTFMEMATGLNRWDSSAQSWGEAVVDLEVFEGGAISRKTAYDAIFAPSADDPNGVFDILMPGGPQIKNRGRFRGQCVGLAMTDRNTGQSVWLAEIKDVAGIAGKDEVAYPDCLVGERGFTSSLRYKLTLAGIAQDIIVQTALPAPAELGFADGANIDVEVWTQLLDAPEPTVEIERHESDPTRRDSRIDFGGMLMRLGSGRAYALDGTPEGEAAALGSGIPVNKEYVQLNGLRFIVESVSFAQVAQRTAALRPLAGNTHARRPALALKDSHVRALPQGDALNRTPRTETATASMTRKEPVGGRLLAQNGYVLDFDLEAGSITDLTLRSDTSYFVKGYVALYGTITLESAVVKFTNANTAALMIDNNGALVVKTDLYRPAIFTACDDNSVGTAIGTGSPTNYYAAYALGYTSANSASISNVVFRYASRGLYFTHPTKTVTNTVANAQFLNCYGAIHTYNGTAYVRNALFNNVVQCYTGYTNLFSSEHVTIDTASQLINDLGASSLTFTNSIFCNVTNFATISGAANITNNSPTALFQQVGSGYHYLNDSFRNLGNGAINPELKRSFASMTTYPPVVLGSDITSDTVLLPAIPRDTDAPDPGYHYAPLDYAASGLNVTNATLTLTNGVAVGVYGAKAFLLRTGSKFISQGTPQQLNRIVRYKNVQEQPIAWGSAGTCMLELDSSGREVRLRFTEIPLIAGGADRTLLGNFDIASYAVTPLAISDCQFLNVSQAFRTLTTGSSLALTNNLFESATFTFEQGTDTPYTFSDYTVSAFNNLFQRGNLTFGYKTVNTVWTIKDNLFLPDTLTTMTSSFNTSASNNGYGTNGLTSLGGGGTKNVYNPDFVAGPLGRFYYPMSGTNLGSLLNAGSRNATNATLFHYTTTGLPETNSVVDIGFHYIAGFPGSDGLVGYWKLDELSGTFAADSSGYGHDGTVSGGAAFTGGEIANGLSFDGGNDLVTTAESPALRLPGDMTVALWFRKDSEPASWPLLVGKGTNSNENFAIWEEYSTGKHLIFEQYDGTNALDLWSNHTVDTNQWTHVAATIKGTLASIYLNGVLDATTTRSFSAPTQALPVKMGYFGYSAAFNGVLDDVRIYNRALTSAEIASLFASYDTDGDGIPDYLEDPNGNGSIDSGETDWMDNDSDGDGIPDGFEISLGTNPLSDEPNTTGQRLNYTYDNVGRLRAVSGKRSETITVDPESNVTQAQP